MSGMEPIALALAGPMGKLAWAGIKKCWVKYRKQKANTYISYDKPNDIVGVELDKTGRRIAELYDGYADKLGARFVQGDYKARRDLFIINNYGDFRVVRNDMSRISNAISTPEDQARSFVTDLNIASEKVLQALQRLATRVDPMFDVDRVPDAMKDGGHLPTVHVDAGSVEITSSLSRALERKISLTIMEGDTEYCYGAKSLQNQRTRSIEDIAVDGKARMQYTYVCKFCFLHISSYQQSVPNWGPYEWTTLAKSHVMACASWLDSRALFKCMDCHQHGREAVTIDAREFILHTQEHLQNAQVRKVYGNSAYSHKDGDDEHLPPKRSHEEIMSELEKDVAAYERLVEEELYRDAEVQMAKATAVPLVEEDEDDDDTNDELYQNRTKEQVRAQKTIATPDMSKTSNRRRDISPLGSKYQEIPPVFKAPTSPPPYESAQHIAQTETTSSRYPDERSTLTPVLSPSPERSNNVSNPCNALIEKETQNYSLRSSRTVSLAKKAPDDKDAASPSPVKQQHIDTKAQFLPASAGIFESDDELAACPGCGRLMKEDAIFEHLDTCHSRLDSQSISVHQGAPIRAPTPHREATTRQFPNHVPPIPTQHTHEVDVATQAAGATGSIFSDAKAYQPSYKAPSTTLPQTYQSAPTRPPPVPPQQEVLRPTVTRKATPKEASENYEAQRYSTQVAIHPQTPSNQRRSRDLHVRQNM